MRTPRFLRYFLLLVALLAVPASSFAGVFVSVNIAPPILPVYEQPYCPGDGYIWTPGYWAYSPNGGYYWVPGAWVLAPYTGALWTPGYWGYEGGGYGWHGGYWGLHIGFYGGVNYGYGYGGHGYEGGYWNHGAFSYNRSVNRINITNVHNVYERNVTVENNSRVAFNGGNGIHAEATPQERVAEHEQHIGAVPLQQQHQQAAMSNRAQFASVNHGNPAVTATQRPGAQAFHQAMAHPDHPEAVQAARSTPASTFHNNGQQNNARTTGNQPQQQTRQQQQARPQQEARPAQQARPQQEARPAQQARPQMQARPAAPAQQARPQGGGGGEPRGGGGGEAHGGGGNGGGGDHGHH
jgi:hypothetical protein